MRASLVSTLWRRCRRVGDTATRARHARNRLDHQDRSPLPLNGERRSDGRGNDAGVIAALVEHPKIVRLRDNSTSFPDPLLAI